MANTYKSVNISQTGGGSSTPFEQTFIISDWVIDGSDYKIDILEATHQRGSDVTIEVQELVGSNYQNVEVFYTITSLGNVTLKIGNDSRFNGRILIQGE